MGRFDEIKYFLPIDKSVEIRPDWCKWLTVGIGGDTLVEKEFHQLYPQCKIFGIEPSPDQYLDFMNYGAVIPAAVGIEPGNLTMRLRIGETYQQRKVPIVPLMQLLDNYVQTRRVTFATMDIEG